MDYLQFIIYFYFIRRIFNLFETLTRTEEVTVISFSEFFDRILNYLPSIEVYIQSITNEDNQKVDDNITSTESSNTAATNTENDKVDISQQDFMTEEEFDKFIKSTESVSRDISQQDFKTEEELLFDTTPVQDVPSNTCYEESCDIDVSVSDLNETTNVANLYTPQLMEELSNDIINQDINYAI